MITLRDVTLRRGVKVVLDAATVTLQPGEKIGLIGRNGAGKSSLFAMLTNRLHADGGDFDMPPRWRLAEVAQNMPETDEGATDFVLQGDTRLMEAQAQLARAEAEDDGHAIADAHHAISDAGGFDARSRAQAMMMGLGFTVAQLDAPVNSFSGGWRMRLQLARALMCPADLMLLDEPTNHLDLDALVWLEAWLQRYDGTLIVISHDREFLDAITRVTLHLDDAKLTRYGGNYTAFEEMRAERMTLQQASYEKQKERIAHLQQFIDRFKAKASKAKQAQSRVKALARMEKLAPVLTAADFSFEFREPLNLPNPMLAMQDVACGYGQTIIVRDIDRSVLAGQRIGILGANGQGKSTLVKTVARMQPALAGTITEGKGLAIGYFAQQEMDVLRPGDSPLNHMIRLARDVSPQAREQELRNFLGQFRFEGDMVHQTVGTLSGGEKARLVLAMLVWQRPNLLLLDEPTNHLDLDTREALSMALNEFEGTVMLVSHDRALLREVCDEFWLVTAGGVSPFDGDLDDYQRWLLDRSKEQAKAMRGSGAAKPSAEAAPKRKEDRKAAALARQQRADQAKPLRKELTRIDHRLGVLFSERDGLEAMFADDTVAPADLADKGKRLKLVTDEIEQLEGRWLEVSTQIDELTAKAD
ncbi:ABC-F family ATP-binding cassette domain-containing protein [Piscinibacter sp.]|uniref:ABC-F family ATP-binding cassette domain-containing protein n=1 Tax=Piscinibacter sp. TaxID=1903157 RepID=UPI002BA9ABCC|nr:ATP-binding cassette domain-containing protein [Albitalea sp.]HUG24995.1 ATP-binding cassette domain-containing protein [Albitalea sp.]